MQQTARSPSYSPAEILEAGRKAESDGRRDYAIQFYRHLTDYYAATPEAVQARYGLQRLAPAPSPEAPQSPLSKSLEATVAAPVQPAPSAGYLAPVVQDRREGYAAAPLILPAPARGFVLGRIIAWALLIAGALLIVGGAGVLGYAISQGLFKPTPAGASAIVVAPSMICGGLLLTLLGELCRAAFRAANASVDLAAIQRALADAEAQDRAGSR
jgi:hypothetical protein